MMNISKKIALLTLLFAGGVASADAAGAQETRRTIAAVRAEPAGWFGFTFTLDRRTDRGPVTVVVTRVEENSGAARGGLQRGDTIVRWNDRSDLEAAIQARRTEPGDTVRLRVRRDGRNRDLTIVAGERPRRVATLRGGTTVVIPEGREFRVIELDSLARSFQFNADSLQRQLRVMFRDSLGPQLRELERAAELHAGQLRIEAERMAPHLRELESRAMELETHADGLARAFAVTIGRGVAGAELTELNPELASYFEAREGVLVLRVVPETPAARAGLRAGDVITRVNGETVGAVRDVGRAVAGTSDRRAELSVLRKGRARTVRLSWD